MFRLKIVQQVNLRVDLLENTFLIFQYMTQYNTCQLKIF